MNGLKIFFTGWLLLLGFCVSAQNLPKKPTPPRLVNDYTNTLTPDQVQTLENKLVAFDDSTSTQIAVVIIPSLDGYDVADYNMELARAWGVGGAEFNNGVVLLIAKNDRKLNIATGYGVEGSLPDITASHIIDDIIVPNFKGDDYYRGISEGTDAIIKAVEGKYKVPRTAAKSKGRSMLPFIIMAIVIIMLMSGRKGGGGKGGQFMSRRGSRGVDAFLLGTLLGQMGGGRSSGGGFGGGFGGGGGGGFGGFGGGGFGGGGASGSW